MCLCMCEYVYEDIYVCVCVYVCINCKCMHVCECMYQCMYDYEYVRICACMYVLIVNMCRANEKTQDSLQKSAESVKTWSQIIPYSRYNLYTNGYQDSDKRIPCVTNIFRISSTP